MNSRLSTGYFNLQRGSRQGDHLSPYNFILVIEILFIGVRNYDSFQGFYINNSIVKIPDYADDAYYFLKDIWPLYKLFKF